MMGLRVLEMTPGGCPSVGAPAACSRRRVDGVGERCARRFALAAFPDAIGGDRAERRTEEPGLPPMPIMDSAGEKRDARPMACTDELDRVGEATDRSGRATAACDRAGEPSGHRTQPGAGGGADLCVGPERTPLRGFFFAAAKLGGKMFAVIGTTRRWRTS